MVQTRSASGIDVPPTPTRPRPRSSAGSRSTRRKTTPAAETIDETSVATTPTPTTPTAPATKATPTTPTTWVYTPDVVTLAWLAVSLPVVAWDTGYVLLRPHTMPGGALHWPVWAPYALYGEVDYIYGFKAWNAHNGFTAAQGTLNLVESLLYLAYLGIWWRAGSATITSGSGTRRRSLTGRPAAWAVLLAFSAAVMTLSKTVLYWLNDYFGGFSNIGHNDLFSLVVLWIIPNGLWIVFPTIMIYTIGSEMLDALAGTSATKPE